MPPVYPRLFLLPKMTLQPLIENCIYHGGVMKKTDGFIEFTAETEGDFFRSLYLRQRAADCGRTGAGDAKKLSMQKDWFVERYAQLETASNYCSLALGYYADGIPREHIGINNVFMRLLFHFGADCTIEILANDYGGTTVRLKLPGQPQSPHPTQFIFSSYRGGMIYEGTDCGR